MRISASSSDERRFLARTFFVEYRLEQAINRYRHSRLLALDNREYLEEMSVRASQTRMAKLREPGAASAATRIGIAFEELLRTGLSRVTNLSDDRVLAYEERRSRGGYTKKYRELDAVAIRGKTLTVFEIKASRSERTALKGIRQLEKTSEILESATIGRTQRIELVLIWVDTGSNAVDIANWLLVNDSDELSCIFNEIYDMERPLLVRILAQAAWDWYQALDIARDDGLWIEHEKEKEIAQRRRELTEAGVDTIDWPADLRKRETTTRWRAEDKTSGGEQAMAAAIRQAFDRSRRE